MSDDDAGRRSDAELEVMHQIDVALHSLDRPAIARVLHWACERYDVTWPPAEGER